MALAARRLLQMFVLFGCLLALPLVASAAGGLDGRFGNRGKLVTEVGDDSIAFAVAVQGDGKPVVGGFGTPTGVHAYTHVWLVARYTLDGRLDSTFDGDGIAVTPFSVTAPALDSVQDLVIQPDGKILAAGTAVTGTRSHFALARYNVDGSLDSGFGSGGKVVTDFGTSTAPTADRVAAMAVAEDGKIVVAGSTSPTAQERQADFALSRYNPDGSADASFGAGGRVVTDVGVYDAAADVAQLSSGKIVVAGTSGASIIADPHIALVRYNGNGTLDSAFGSGGKLLLGSGFATSVLAQRDGKLLLAGGLRLGEMLPFDPLLRRYDANGALDKSYGDEGNAATGNFRFASVTFDARGRALVVGDAGPLGDFLVARYTGTGHLDAGFGRGGYVETDWGSSDVGLDVAVAPNGKIVAAGEASQEGSRYKIALARYLPTYCLVPRLAGLSLASTKRAIAGANCTLGAIHRVYSKSVPKDRVIAQTPAAGVRLAESSRVNVTVSRGKKRR
jgi:uncharacterized delta-60 repeat protein